MNMSREPMDTVTPCISCGSPDMDTQACPNARDLCLDCCGEAH